MMQILINNTPLIVGTNNFPIAIHGKEGSGASLFSIVMAALLCRSGSPIFFWSAYSRAKKEFKKELDKNIKIHSIMSMSQITDDEPQIIILENSSAEELGKALPQIDPNRIFFIKNFETLPEALRRAILKRNPTIISGDLENIINPDNLKKFSTKIYFSPFFGIDLPKLKKYQGVMFLKNNMAFVSVTNFPIRYNNK